MVTIRAARVADAESLCAIETEVSGSPGLLVSSPDEISLQSFVRVIENLGGDIGCYLVAEENKRIIGHAFLRPMDLRAVSHVYRLTIVVKPANWKHGIGDALMGGLCAWAANSPRVEKVELLVRSTNRAALALYAKFGFFEEGRLKNRIRLPSGAYVDDISMAWFPNRAHA